MKQPETVNPDQMNPTIPPVPIMGLPPQIAQFGSLGQAGLLIAAVAALWTRIDTLEARFDSLEVQIETFTTELSTYATTLQVMNARNVSREEFTDLERRVAVIESKRNP